jgi:hypothetical protein
MNIRLVGAALLLLLSTLSLSPIAEAQTGGVSTTFRVSGQVTNPVIFNLAKLQKFAVSTQNVTFFAAGQVTSGSYTGALLWDVLQSAGIKVDPNVKNDILRFIVVVTGSDGYEASFGVITHRHFRRADRDEAPDFRTPLPGSPISESMCAWIALICSA